MRASISFVLVGALTLIACGREAVREPVDTPTRPEVKDIVARVGERPIGAAGVAARMREEGLGAEHALDRLIEEDLLVQEATRRGITLDLDKQRAVERVMVRAMVRDFETALTPESIPDKEVRADFAANREKLELPERRDSWHILVKDSSAAGRRLARSILTEVLAASDPKSVYRRYAEDTGGEIAVVAEDLPPMATRANIEQPYKDALFGAESTGPIDSLVETSYGWHVIVLTEILPAKRSTLSEMEAEIRERLSQKKRFEKLVEVVQAREADGLVEYDDEGIARFLAMPELPVRAE